MLILGAGDARLPMGLGLAPIAFGGVASDRFTEQRWLARGSSSLPDIQLLDRFQMKAYAPMGDQIVRSRSRAITSLLREITTSA